MRSVDLNDLIVKAYEHVLDSGGWDGRWLSELTGASPEAVEEARKILIDLRAIEPGGWGVDGWRAVSPRLAMAEIVLPIDAEVRRRARDADKLRGRLRMLLPAYESKLRPDSLHAIQAIGDADDLAKLVNDELSACSAEFAVMLSRVDHDEIAGWYQRARGQGARIRAVYQHSVPAAGRPDGGDASGLPVGELRTIAEVPMGMLLFDRTTSVLLEKSADAGVVAVVARHPVAVSVMVGVFEEVWSRSTPGIPRTSQSASLDDDTLRAVVRLMATGAKDDAVARRLGISIRTCRRYVAELMNSLDTSSRFQAGIEVTRRGLV